MAPDSYRTTGGLWVQEVGDGPLVVLVHGAMDRAGGMLRTRRALQGSCRVVRYDRRGYGRSLAVGPPRSFGQQVDDLVDVLADRPAVVAGHSFGGIVALSLAERSPQLVRAVLAYEAPMPWESWWPGARAEGEARPADPADAAESFLRRMIGDATWERLPATMRAERRAEGAAFVAELASVGPGTAPAYRPERISVPVIAAYGTLTKPRHRQAAAELARRAPQAELAVVEGASHGAHLTHPGDFADLVRRALALAEGIPAH